MAHTLRSLSAEKIVKKVDGFRARLADIKIVDGFNVRTNDDELREHIAGIAGAIAAGLPIPPIEVWVDPDTGAIEAVDGHCRHAAYHLYAESSSDFDGWVSVVKFDGTPAQRKARTVNSNTQLRLKPVELGRAYLSLRDEHQMSRQEIAQEVGRSLAHIDQMILLASAGVEVIAAVEAGQISATEAVKLTRDHGENAPAELERRKEAAKESGKEKVTAKVAPKKKAAGNPGFVVSAANALVDSLPSTTSVIERDGGQFIEVRLDMLQDLISCVRELKDSGKALDADKQAELPV